MHYCYLAAGVDSIDTHCSEAVPQGAGLAWLGVAPFTSFCQAVTPFRHVWMSNGGAFGNCLVVCGVIWSNSGTAAFPTAHRTN